MYEARQLDEVTVIRGVGELSREELSGIAELARGEWWSST